MLFDSQKQGAPIVGSVVIDNPTPAEKKPLNKKLLFGIIGGVLAFVAVVLAIVIIANKSQEPSGDNVVGKFNIYARYILYDDDKNFNTITESYDISKTYAMEKKLEAGDNIYFNNAQTLWNDFVKSYNASNQKNDSLTDKINNYQDELEFLRQYSKIAQKESNFMSGGLLQKYLNNGLDVTKQYVVETYNEMSQSFSEAARKYAAAGVKFYGNMVDVYDDENKRGCIVDGQETEACWNDEEANEEMSAAEMLMSETLIKSQNHVLEGCWSIGKELDNKTPELTFRIDDLDNIEENGETDEE